MPARVAALVGKLRIGDARTYLGEVAPKVTQFLDEIESQLKKVWESEMRQQGERTISHKGGDLLCGRKLDGPYAWKLRLRRRGISSRSACAVGKRL